MMGGKVCLYWLLAVLSVLYISDTHGQNITVTDNGYSGILVAISDCVSEKDYPNLLNDLKVSVLLQNDSLILRKHTKGGYRYN